MSFLEASKSFSFFKLREKTQSSMKIYFCLEESPPKKKAFYVCVVSYSWFHRIFKIKEKKKNQ